QVAVMLSLANHHASLPVAYRLYLPKEWANDEARCRKAGVPDDIEFMTKPEIALEQIRWACEAGLPRGVVLMDAGYGASTELRRSITALDLTYVAGILPNTTVWEEGEEPLPPKQSSGRGRPAKLLRRDAKHQPISVKELSLNLPASTWRKVTWREGVAAPLSSRFARVRVRVAHRDYKLTEPPTRKNGWSLSGRKEKRSRPSIGFQLYRTTSAFIDWSIAPSCVGVSSTTIRSSSKRLGWATSKDEGGAGSTITPRCRSRFMSV